MWYGLLCGTVRCRADEADRSQYGGEKGLQYIAGHSIPSHHADLAVGDTLMLGCFGVPFDGGWVDALGLKEFMRAHPPAPVGYPVAVWPGLEKAFAAISHGVAASDASINVDAEGVFTGSFGLLVSVQGSFDSAGKLTVDVQQLKGQDLADFLDGEGGREQAMESRRRWSSFLDEATGYNAKQRGDKAKEEAKKFSKAKSAIKMAHKSMELMKNLDEATVEKANELIATLESSIESGTPPSETQVKKLNDLF